jgi:malonyl-CoA decarboxylase
MENENVAVQRRSWLAQVGMIAARGRMVLRLRGGAATGPPESLCGRLIEQRGEASALALAAEVIERIQRLDEREIAHFLDVLAKTFSPDAKNVETAVRTWQREHDPEALVKLAAAVEAPRQELFRRINMAPEGTATLVKLRGRLLALLRDRPHLLVVDADLRHLFTSWFNRGFLQLEQITWNTPAAILERLIAYEAVHAIRDWDDLRARLAADRRCFAFFHPALPGEPLVFVEVALTKGLAGSIQSLIEPGRLRLDPEKADTAIFFSISNTQDGLRGISFGSFLIKQVMGELSSELPRLTTFATLSPVPGLAQALRRRDDPDGFTEARLRSILGGGSGQGRRNRGEADPLRPVERLLQRDGPRTPDEWRLLETLTLAYLTGMKRGSRVTDPVGHFHLSNGARLERIHPEGDATESGGRSCGVMVNYLYDPDGVELNHERYVETGDVSVARSLAGEAKRLQAAWQLPRPEPARMQEPTRGAEGDEPDVHRDC